MKSLSGRQFCRLLERHGWSLLRIQGSHHVYGKPGERVRISVPVHGNAALKRGLQQRLMNSPVSTRTMALDRCMAATTRWGRGGFVLGRELPGGTWRNR